MFKQKVEKLVQDTLEFYSYEAESAVRIYGELSFGLWFTAAGLSDGAAVSIEKKE